MKKYRSVGVILLTIFSLVVSTETSAQSASNNKWYQDGYAAIMDRDPETLTKWGIIKAFGATGMPVKSKMERFCRSFTVWEIDALSKAKQGAARKVWHSGCLAAGMSLRLSDIYAGNN
jgi:hypothetical protein